MAHPCSPPLGYSVRSCSPCQRGCSPFPFLPSQVTRGWSFLVAERQVVGIATGHMLIMPPPPFSLSHQLGQVPGRSFASEPWSGDFDASPRSPQSHDCNCADAAVQAAAA